MEQDETIQVTRHGELIAVLLPGSGMLERYASLVAKGIIRLKATTTSDLDRIPRYATPPDVCPLDILLAERAEDDRWRSGHWPAPERTPGFEAPSSR